MNKRRILIIGDSPYIDTGFGYLTRNIGKALVNAGHEIASLGLWDKRKNDNQKQFNNHTILWKVYGCKTSDFKTYGTKEYKNVIGKFNPDLIIIITDIWIANCFLDVDIPTIFYFHVEGSPIPIKTQGINEILNWPLSLLKCDHIVFAGNFGKEETYKRLSSYVKEIKTNTNIDELFKKCTIIPDGIDMDVFKPLDNKEELKKRCLKLPGNSFVVGYFGRQNPRKGIPYALEAFAKWPGRPDNAFFYCHCPLNDKSGWDLLRLIKDLDIQQKVIVNTNIQVEKGVTEKELNEFYNACDIVASPSLGEGFGQTTCVLPGAIVRTNRGHIPIEEVNDTDEVLTHMGRFQKVKEVFKTWYKGGVRVISTKISPQFSVTPTHKILTRFFQPVWKLTSRDYLKYPIVKEHQKCIDELNKEFKLSEKLYKNEIGSEDPNTIYKIRDMLYSKNKSMYNVIRKHGKKLYLSLFKKIRVKKVRFWSRQNRLDVSRAITKIEGIKKTRYEGYVYNMNVDKDHSFTVNGVAILHNCQSLSTGVPVIVTDYSELSNFEQGTYKIKPIAFYVEPRSNIRRAIPGIKDLYKCYKKAYKDFTSNRMKMIALEARNGILKYDWSNVNKMWTNFIDTIPFKHEEIIKTENKISFGKLVSVIMPLYNSNPIYLQRAIDSVMNQTYKDIELIMVDDGSDHTNIINESVTKWNNEKNKRINIVYLEKNVGIAKATTKGIKIATGEYVGFMDHDDILESKCIEKTITFLETQKTYGMVYTDEREIDTNDNPLSPIYKEDYNADLHLGVAYLNHFQLYRKKLLDEFLPLKHSGAQDYDLTLRFAEKHSIGHLREILYGWRRWKESSLNVIKPETIATNKQVVLDTLVRRNIKGTVTDGPEPTKWYIDRDLQVKDPVEIIIINKDKPHFLDACISSIEKHTKYPYKITIVDTGSTDPRVLKLLKTTKYKVLYDKFNFSNNNNLGSDNSDCKYLCLLNNDIIVSENWLTEMMKQLQRDNVGIVGPKLIFPNDTIQHAGLVYGISGLAYHIYIGANKNIWNVNMVKEVNAVTGACLLVKKNLYEKAGKLDPEYMIEFQDVDLCLSIQKLGYKIIYTPRAELVHFTSISRGNPTNIQAAHDRSKFVVKWNDIIISSPDMNTTQDKVDPMNRQRAIYWIELGKKLKEINENRNRNNNVLPSGNPDSVHK